jgi:hypothetical protein
VYQQTGIGQTQPHATTQRRDEIQTLKTRGSALRWILRCGVAALREMNFWFQGAKIVFATFPVGGV